MLTDFLLGILGPIIGLLTIKFFGIYKARYKQKTLLLLLTGITLIFYLIFGLFDLGTEVGPELNLGLFKISHGVSEALIITLTLFLPIILGIILTVSLRGFTLPKRLLVPVALVLVVISINTLQTHRELIQHQWDFEKGIYNDFPE